jgi:adenylate cyclase
VKLVVFPGSIRTKLIVAATALLVGGVTAVVWLSTTLYGRDARAFILKSSSENADSLGNLFRLEVQQVLDRARGYASLSLRKQNPLKALIGGDSAILGLQLIDFSSGRVLDSAYQQSVENPGEFVVNLKEQAELKPGKVAYQGLEAGNRFVHQAVTSVSHEGDEIHTIMALFIDPKTLASPFKGDGVSELVLFDGRGNILLKSESASGDGLIQGRSVPTELSQVAAASPLTNGIITISLRDGAQHIGSFYRTGVSDVSVGVLISEEKAFEAPRLVARRSIYLGFAILGVALACAILFSESLVSPIRKLADAAQKIADGDFQAKVYPETKDEIATLGSAFNQMASGLAEREKLKDVFTKFHSKHVVDKLMSEDRIKLGGERVPTTVFFSDIRSFTSSSEKMTPEDVVRMLNEYMTKMVSEIEEYGGVVDKYVGDAIMAVWGLTERNPPKDAEMALRACLSMRERLVQLNEFKKARGQDPIAIGMGLNSGEVISGNIGSPSRMEFTVIGDTVNTASRMESLTKEFKTDLLINESTVKLLPPGVFDLTGPFEAHAKGKAEAILVYGCKGYLAAEKKEAA